MCFSDFSALILGGQFQSSSSPLPKKARGEAKRETFLTLYVNPAPHLPETKSASKLIPSICWGWEATQRTTAVQSLAPGPDGFPERNTCCPEIQHSTWTANAAFKPWIFIEKTTYLLKHLYTHSPRYKITNIQPWVLSKSASCVSEKKSQKIYTLISVEFLIPQCLDIKNPASTWKGFWCSVLGKKNLPKVLRAPW